jgi:cytochrome oxidase assembly protein ShyY1
MSSATAKKSNGLRLLFGVLATAAIVGFSLLGRWQWQRAGQKRAIQQAFAAGMAAAPIALDAQSLLALPRYAHLELHGRYDGAHQFLLDNISRGGRAGYEILTPFRLDDGRAVLVNRGWLSQPGGDRSLLPSIELGAQPLQSTSIVARIDDLPATGLESGRAAPATDARWPKLTSFRTRRRISRQARGTPVVAGCESARWLPPRLATGECGIRTRTASLLRTTVVEPGCPRAGDLRVHAGEKAA